MTDAPIASSTNGHVWPAPIASSTNGHTGRAPIASSIIDIERRRAVLGVPHNRLCALSGVHPQSWFELRRGERTPKPATVARLAAALEGFSAKASPKKTPPPLAALFCLVARVIARERRVRIDHFALLDFSAEKPNSRAWLKAAQVRRLAMYLLAVELCIPNADLARALGCSRQNIKQARDAVEDWRDRQPAIEALLVRLAGMVG